MTREGAERTETEPIWPRKLVRPRTKLIYLDLNHWIALAKADAGHPHGERWRSAMQTMRDRRSGWTYVLGGPLVFEVTGNRRRGQRGDLGRVIEEFTDYASILPLPDVAALEFDASLAAFTSGEERLPEANLLGSGVLYAFGISGGLRIYDRERNDVTAVVRQRSPIGVAEFDRKLAEAERLLDHALIFGPRSEAEEQELFARGWKPAELRAWATRRAEQEVEFARLLDDETRWRRGRLRDLVTGRYMVFEIERVRDDALQAHGVRISAVLDGIENARAFADGMPSADVFITLRTAKHRNASSSWTANDVFDIDALSVAAAYCDVVVTERHSAHVLAQAGTGLRYGTSIFTDLGQLADHLERSGGDGSRP